MKVWENIGFKVVENRELQMDLYVPADVQIPPIIMWIHGGGWNALNRSWSLIMPMISRGYAVASVDYRYADEAPFPAQILDLKDALLFLKKHGKDYGYDASKIILSGDSAGAHLACLVGVSEGHSEWEKAEEDYSVQAVVEFCAPTCFEKIIAPDAKAGDYSVIEGLLGVPCDSEAFLTKAKVASPITYINGKEPPFLIIHGSEDPVVSMTQGRILRNALEQAGDSVHMYFVPGGMHAMGGKLIDDMVCEFLDYYIKGNKTVEEPKVLACHQRV